ncbi:MAG: ferrous iron transport protein A [Chlorobiaceae bacterium]|nr:ferrous iron transport protein A [Chlorobiaceae bacterium]
MKLSELKVGDRAEVVSMQTDPLVRRRLMDLGLIRGTELKVLRVAPLGDPIEIVYKGLYLTLRKSEAEGVGVRLIDTAGVPGNAMGQKRHRMRFGRAS